MTYEELVEHIRAFPGSLSGHDGRADEGAVGDVVAEAMDEVALAVNLARATQESLKTRVEIARGRGATWTMIGDAIGVTAWRAEQRYFEKRPFGARW